MTKDRLLHYTHLFMKLRRDYKFGGAPHKPVLLLAIINLVRNGEITNNRISITFELVLEFKEIWSKIVETPHTANFALPFYHLKSEPFWKLITKAGMEIPITSSNSIRSLSALQETLAFAEIDSDLFLLLKDNESSLILQQIMLEKYFPNTKNNFYHAENSIVSQVKTQILEEDQYQYSERISQLRNQLSVEEFQEEIYVRGGVFKREIPKIYDFQCAISGMRIESLRNIQMIDACHVVPFAISKDDTISNGIALSPNLHRAFDRGLITLNDDYRVVITSKIIESKSNFSLAQFSGKSITLPQNKIHYPGQKNLLWHRKEVFLL